MAGRITVHRRLDGPTTGVVVRRSASIVASSDTVYGRLRAVPIDEREPETAEFEWDGETWSLFQARRGIGAKNRKAEIRNSHGDVKFVVHPRWFRAEVRDIGSGRICGTVHRWGWKARARGEPSEVLLALLHGMNIRALTWQNPFEYMDITFDFLDF